MDFLTIALSVIVSVLLILVCMMMYFSHVQQIAQLNSARLHRPHAEAAHHNSPDMVRRQRAQSFDQMLLLEADLTQHGRQTLTAEEIQAIDTARTTIIGCVDELKMGGDWMGVPFDLEWVELLERLPILKRLYLLAELAAMEADAAGIPQAAAKAVSPAPENPKAIGVERNHA
ncbi:MAG: hypothetical protein EBY24_13465 [Betaproteobacteria bacterium]|nr:hypothetical protein [Betaproteobacteria bacterium]